MRPPSLTRKARGGRRYDVHPAFDEREGEPIADRELLINF